MVRSEGYQCPVCGAYYNMYCSMCRQYEVAVFVLPNDYVYIDYQIDAPTLSSESGRLMMGKVRFEYYSHDLNSVEGSVNLYRSVETGGEVYWPDADYQALERQLAALVGAAEALSVIIPEGDPIWKRAADKLKAAIAAAKAKP